MSEALELKNISKRFGVVSALEDVTLTLPAGKLVCFLGPSGCGKTTLLRLIAGLETPTSGNIYLGDKDLTKIPAHQRNIGMVFQSFALFPHLNVAENIAYGLKIRGADKSSRLKRAAELLELVKLSGLDKRHISQLSGGQKQRVAMARALALEPDLFLLDEPLSALDAKLREAMQVELKLLQQRVGLTTIIVTHDQQEAMTMADVIVVMGDNRVQQVGEPLEIYHRPSNRFVADFIGANNFLEATVVDSGRVKTRDQSLTVQVPASFKAGQAVTLSIRPEKFRLSTSEPITHDNLLQGNVTFVRDLGSLVETFVDTGGINTNGQTLRVVGAAHQVIGSKVWLSFSSQDCVVLASEVVST
jgi:putative spermidine/putrescine transport system ATP-binding protein